VIERHGLLPDDPAQALLAYLDEHRADVRTKILELDPDDLTTSRVPSGWSPLGLLNHLVHMERRWLVWLFDGELVDRPWADDGETEGDPWRDDDVSPGDLLARLDEGGRRTRRIVEAHALDERRDPLGRLPADEVPSLQAILLHVCDEYARHLGHLDVAVELARG
jgi:uncharacterized damage-inducible protein DinB